MIRVLAFIRRLPGVSRDAFRTHYEEIHVPIALPLLTGTSGYVRHHVREELYGRADFDCMTRFEYPDPATVRAVFERTEGPQAEAIRHDERGFMDKPRRSSRRRGQRWGQGGAILKPRVCCLRCLSGSGAPLNLPRSPPG